jgi:hypothetical protein
MLNDLMRVERKARTSGRPVTSECTVIRQEGYTVAIQVAIRQMRVAAENGCAEQLVEFHRRAQWCATRNGQQLPELGRFFSLCAENVAKREASLAKRFRSFARISVRSLESRQVTR